MCVALVLACSQEDQEKQETLFKVKVGITKTYLGEAATFTAKKYDFCKSNGLDVTLKRNSTGSESIRDPFNGAVDIAHVAETPIVYTMLDTTYIKRGEIPDFQIYGDMIYSYEIQKIIAHKGSGTDRAEDLKGKRIGIYEGMQLDYFFDSYLLEHQVPKDSIIFINLKPESQVKVITQRVIDVAVTWEPYATYIANQLGEHTKYLNTKLTYSTLWLSTTLDSYAKSNPKVLESYLESIKEAQAYIHENPLEEQRLLSDQTGVPLEVVQSCWKEIDYDLSLSGRMLTLFEDQANWLRRNSNTDS